MLLPARLLLDACALWFALGIASAIVPPLLLLWWTVGGLILLMAVIDLARSWWEPEPAANRVVKSTLPLGVPSTVEITLGWARSKRAACLADHAPAGFECHDLPATLTLDPAQETKFSYRLRPLLRGEHRFGPIAIRIRSPWSLWWKQIAVRTDSTVKVYPNFAAYSRHALQAADVSANRMGVLKRRRRGEGLDFEQLREYRMGDSPRQIDWKATARIGKLISREFQDERDQRILLLADCGRRMGARDSELSHFDHALDTLLLLAYVGLRHGDSVGMMTLGGPRRMLAPHKSTATLSRILHAVYDLQPTLEATDFELAAQSLLTRERKRALVVILTNVRDEDDESLLAAVHLLSRHHLVLVASLRERSLDDACAEPPTNAASHALRGTALDYRARRDASFRRLRQAGVLCLDVGPGELAIATVNHYLEIKGRGLL